MYDLCIFAPLAWERLAVSVALDDRCPAGAGRWQARSAGGRTCFLVQTGVGPTRAARAATTAPRARCMLVCGCAGALAAGLSPGTVVVASAVEDADTGERFATAAPPIATWAHPLGLAVSTGTVLTSATLLASAAAKHAAGADGALVIDMESAAIAREAAVRDVPLVVLRVVLDRMDDAMPPGDLVDADSGRIKLARALAHFAPPSRWPDAVRLATRQRTADRALRRLMRALLGAPCDLTAHLPVCTRA